MSYFPDECLILYFRMISYNPRDWRQFLFFLHKSDTLAKLWPLLLSIGAYAALVAFLEVYYFKLGAGNYLRNTTVIHTLLGFAISMLLVFRTNTAYERWWEGRKLWGALVNNSRNLAIKLQTFLPIALVEERVFFRQLIPRFAMELQAHLQKEETRYQLDEKPHPEIPDFDKTKHGPMQVALLMQQRIYALQQQGLINENHLWLLNSELSAFADISGACERIKNTPIPYSYSAFIKKFIFFYVVSLPIGYAFTLGFLAVPVTILLLYVLGSLELIAEEIEDPFGRDTNDLPMTRITEGIARTTGEILA